MTKSAQGCCLLLCVLIGASVAGTNDLSCTASKVFEMKARVEAAQESGVLAPQQVEKIKADEEKLIGTLGPLYTEAGSLESRLKTFPEWNSKDAAARTRLWHDPRYQDNVAKSLDLQEKLNRVEAQQRALIDALPTSDYENKIASTASDVAAQHGFTLEGLADSPSYRALLSSYRALESVSKSGTLGEKVTFAVAQSRLDFDTRDPVPVAVDVTNQALRLLDSEHLRVQLGGGHLEMYSPPPADRPTVMKSKASPLAQTMLKRSADLLNVHEQINVARKTLDTIKVPPPPPSASATQSTGERLGKLADAMKKKSELIVEIIMVGTDTKH